MTIDHSVVRSWTAHSTAATTVQAAAQRMYEHEVALHAARQSGVALWISAAADRLHDAILEYAAALSSADDQRVGSAPLREVARRRPTSPLEGIDTALVRDQMANLIST